jgi:phage gpG-like protein
VLTFKINFPHAKRLADKLPEDFQRALVAGLRKAILVAEAGAKTLAPVDTGHLRRSIRSGVDLSHIPTGWVGSDVRYARIQELGGVIRPKTAKWLRFKIGDRWITTKSVTIKGRFYLQKGMTQNQGRIMEIIKKTVIETMERE